MDAADAVEFARTNHRAVLHTNRGDGSPQLSPVTVGTDGEALVISTRETAMKTKNLLRDPRASVCLLPDDFYGPWLVASGPAEVVHLPEAMDLLVEYYRTISGEHPDWDEYRAAMVEQRRVVVRIRPDRVGPTVSG
jgi:PPOX class probable F420-dependent enzyme